MSDILLRMVVWMGALCWQYSENMRWIVLDLDGVLECAFAA